MTEQSTPTPAPALTADGILNRLAEYTRQRLRLVDLKQLDEKATADVARDAALLSLLERLGQLELRALRIDMALSFILGKNVIEIKRKPTDAESVGNPAALILDRRSWLQEFNDEWSDTLAKIEGRPTRAEAAAAEQASYEQPTTSGLHRFEDLKKKPAGQPDQPAGA